MSATSARTEQLESSRIPGWLDVSRPRAFVYGVTVIYRERPYVNVFAVDRFGVYAHPDIDGEQWEEALAAGTGEPLDVIDVDPWIPKAE